VLGIDATLAAAERRLLFATAEVVKPLLHLAH
jgi:hypothetical protein